jgi:predicted nucleic acid-binding protein
MLLDSNIIIDAAQPENGLLRRFIAAYGPVVSAVSAVEVLGYFGLTEGERRHFEEFFAAATVLPLSAAVVEQAVKLRQQKDMALADALLAATALVFGCKLVTRNTERFDDLGGLEVLNPFDKTRWSKLEMGEPNDSQ